MPAYYYHIFFEVDPDDAGRARCFDGVVSRRNLLLPPVSPKAVIQSGGLAGGRSRTDGGQPDRPAGNVPGPRQDWRSGRISVHSIDMGPSRARTSPPRGPAADGALRGGGTLETGVDATATKGRFVSLATQETDLGWGVVHLYRDGEEMPGLYDDGDDSADLVRTTASALSMSAAARPSTRKSRSVTSDEDCTTVCILAVPLYLTPADFMGFIGEPTTSDITHIRMVRTERVNRYMVLMKFRDAERAKRWRKQWNGKPFNSVEPEYCHVVFIKSIRFQSPGRGNGSSTYPNIKNDPLTPASTAGNRDQPGLTHAATKLGRSALSTKPTAPPTPSLVELPTCPVCLERMDETTGLLTILCQHVFHCECLQKWRGTGCPVCRYTQGDGTELSQGQALGSGHQDALCSVCGAESNLWICLICGNVGCGRYDEAHAFSHFEETGHSYVMDIDTQRVWDYVGDGYVHRLIQDKSDAKLEELPSRTSLASDYAGDGGGMPSHADELRAQAKLDDIEVEYTHLLRSQLESQRLYFEEKIAQAADKASQASRVAEDSMVSCTQLRAEFDALSSAHATLSKDTMPSLERDNTRLERRAEKASSTARAMEKAWREEKTMNESLMQRISHLEADVAASKTRNDELQRLNADLDDQNRDLACFISGSDKIARLNEEDREDVAQGTVSLGEARGGSGLGGAGTAGTAGAGKKSKNKNKNKGKGKGKGVGVAVGAGASVGANTATGEDEGVSTVEGPGTAEGAGTAEGTSASADAGAGTGVSTDVSTGAGASTDNIGTGTKTGAGASMDTSPGTGTSTETS